MLSKYRHVTGVEQVVGHGQGSFIITDFQQNSFTTKIKYGNSQKDQLEQNE